MAEEINDLLRRFSSAEPVDVNGTPYDDRSTVSRLLSRVSGSDATDVRDPAKMGDARRAVMGPTGLISKADTYWPGPEAPKGWRATAGAILGSKPVQDLMMWANFAGGAPGAALTRGILSKPAVVSRPSVTGARELGTEVPATVGGKGPAHWGTDEFKIFGEQFGRPEIGNASPLETVSAGGGSYRVPRAFLEDGPAPSYWDQLALKSEGVNPMRLEEATRGKIHDRMMDAVQPEGPSVVHPYNGMLFGMSSPNNPLTPNMIAVARTMAKSPADIRAMADMTPWSLGDAATVKGGRGSQRQALSREISSKLGLGAGKDGGLGVVGSADWTRMSDFAKMYDRRPSFFEAPINSKDPAAWEEAVGRIASQVPGLSYKTGSFGTVWQSPKTAQISAMDRHMASAFRENLFADPKEQLAWERDLVNSFNKEYKLKGESKVASLDEMLKLPGGRGMYGDAALQYLGNHLDPQFRLASGEINPRLPEHLRGADWVLEPQNVLTMSPAYTRALRENARLAGNQGRAIFPEQWRIWDGIRNRMEPHEVMNPKLAEIGRMNLSQLKAARDAHAAAGYMTSPGQVRPVENPGSLALFSAPAATVAAGGMGAFLDQQGGPDEGL